MSNPKKIVVTLSLSQADTVYSLIGKTQFDHECEHRFNGKYASWAQDDADELASIMEILKKALYE